VSLQLSLWPDLYAVCRLEPDHAIPHWALSGPFISVTRTDDELSIIVRESDVPMDVNHEGGWRAFKLQGPFEFSLVGILASVLDPLRDAGVGIFAISTFDTDFVLVQHDNVDAAVHALTEAGHIVVAHP